MAGWLASAGRPKPPPGLRSSFTYSSTTSLVGSWVVRGEGAGLGGGCGSPGARTAALALDFLQGMSHEREALKSEEAITWILRAQNT